MLSLIHIFIPLSLTRTSFLVLQTSSATTSTTSLANEVFSTPICTPVRSMVAAALHDAERLSKAELVPSQTTEFPLHGVPMCSDLTSTSTDEDIHVRMMLDSSGEVVRNPSSYAAHLLILVDFMSG